MPGLGGLELQRELASDPAPCPVIFISGDGEIHIRTWESPGAVHIAISDTGRGIPEAVLPRIFEPGFTTRKSAHGEGLGLAICSRIVQNHNGRIDVESREGKGSTFNITLERNEND